MSESGTQLLELLVGADLDALGVIQGHSQLAQRLLKLLPNVIHVNSNYKLNIMFRPPSDFYVCQDSDYFGLEVK